MFDVPLRPCYQRTMARPKKEDALNARERVALRITPAQRERLNDMSARRHRSISDEIREAIDGHIARDNAPSAKREKRK